MKDIEMTEEAQVLLKVSKYVKEQFKDRMKKYSKNRNVSKDISKGLRAAMLYTIAMNDDELDKLFELSDSMMIFYALWDRNAIEKEIDDVGGDLIPGLKDKIAPNGPFTKIHGRGLDKAAQGLNVFFKNVTSQMESDLKDE